MTKRALIFSLLVFSVCGCSRPIAAKPAGDVNKPIEVKAGSSFVIMLDSNPTTGYSWQLAGKLDEKYLKCLGSRFAAFATKLIGAGGREFWSFKAIKKGRAAVSFKYVRPWEKEASPARQEAFDILIK